MIRVADAAGADAVLLAGDTVDPHNGKAVRASTGSIFHLPLARGRDATAVLDACRAAGLTLLAADARGSSTCTTRPPTRSSPGRWRGSSVVRRTAFPRPSSSGPTTASGCRSTVEQRV